MRLYVIRHGIAEPRTAKMKDADRPLTLKGRKRFQREVKALDRMGVRFDLLLTSPWTRAAETADFLRPLVAGDCVRTEALAKPPSPALLEKLEGECVAIVGHQPWLTELAAWLAFGVREQGKAIGLKKGGVLVLEGLPVPGGMVLQQQLTPKVLRGLSRRGRLRPAA